MGGAVVLFIVSYIFFLIYNSSRKESYGADYVKDLPQAEGTIVMVKQDGRFIKYNVEFKVNGRKLIGESISYINTHRKYYEGCKVRFWYKMFRSGGCQDARVVLQDTDLISSDKSSTENAWKILIFVVGFAVSGLIVLVYNLLG